mmetsp:Transcript_18861/g.40868  ORF Transcript_18861/g.40868 Transcript_18861/m.40868 type:complete len:218 (+) Transcript_18861:445-1098(+)
MLNVVMMRTIELTFLVFEYLKVLGMIRWNACHSRYSIMNQLCSGCIATFVSETAPCILRSAPFAHYRIIRSIYLHLSNIFTPFIFCLVSELNHLIAFFISEEVVKRNDPRRLRHIVLFSELSTLLQWKPWSRMNHHTKICHSLRYFNISVVSRSSVDNSFKHGIQLPWQQSRSNIVTQRRTAYLNVDHITRLTRRSTLYLHVRFVRLTFPNSSPEST